MTRSLVLTLLGDDRPGLVEAVSRSIAGHGANWTESRMARLGGKFAGILLIEVPAERCDALAAELRSLDAQGFRVIVEESARGESPRTVELLELELVGQDRPGIVRDISRVLAQRGVNVLELETGCTSAPMSGETLFRASATVELPPSLPASDLCAVLEALANDLMVDLKLGEPRAT